MKSYLSEKIADYLYEILNIPSTTVLPQTGTKTQISRGFDDGTDSTTTVSADNYFNIELMWEHITRANLDTLMDLWLNKNKADGMARTVYWSHPLDGNTYTVRFMGPIKYSYNPEGYLSVDPIPILIEGYRIARYWIIQTISYWDTPMTDLWATTMET